MAAKRQNLSIHGRDRETGRLADQKWNMNPQPSQEPRTERGKRRRKNKGK